MCVTLMLLAETSGGIDWAGWGTAILAILAAAVGLGFIIFVHELGHFLVAKACGVKCDKFMIGFDIGGYKIGKQVGETYYGIGILPLGGYVRMLGQNDDPRMTAEQIRESEATAGQEGIATKEIVGPGGEKHLVDARSYIAKSVPQRMAIISAGVVMNIIFAFVFALIAFRIGVPSMPSIISGTDPGAPAWQAGLMADDELVRLNDIENPWYDQLRQEVTLSGKGEAVEFEVKKADTGEIETIEIKPSRERQKIAQVGVTGPQSLELNQDQVAIKFSPAAAVEDKLPGGGLIIAAGGQPVESYRQLTAALVKNQSQPLTLTVQPPKKSKKDAATPEPVTVEIAARPEKYVGLVMKMGPVTAVQYGSPAAAAGLREGDKITAINGAPVGLTEDGSIGWDPRTMAQELAQLGEAGETVELTVERGDGESPSTETISITPRPVDWIEQSISPKSSASIPALGIAYYMLSEVVGVVPDSPAAEADIEPGDKLTSAKLIVEKEYKKQFAAMKEPLEINDEQQAWAAILRVIQDVPPGTKLQLTVERPGREEPAEVELSIATDPDHFTADRGLVLMPILRDRVGETFGEQASMAWAETKSALGSVYRFLYRIVNGEIDPRLLGGPITIAKASYFGALEGPGRLLLFLTLISANLAVVNFLPIPVLDGGHMVFLAYEGIFRRPANEYFAGIMNLAGLAFIVCLMLFVFGLDLGLIPRNL